MKAQLSHPIASSGRSLPTGALPAVLTGAVAVAFTLAVLLGGLPAALLLLLLLPGILPAYVDSKRLLPYVMFVWVVAPEARRVCDWIEGTYHPVSILSAAPLAATLLLILPNMRRPLHLPAPVRGPLLLLALPLFTAFTVGLVRNGFSAFYDFANYAVPVLFLLYACQRPIRAAERDTWIASLGALAVVAAAYGWIQYIFAPPWDAFWMNHTIMMTIGKPEPFQIRVFSLLNSPGIASAFFGAALAPMILERRWRKPFGWPGVVLTATALALTLVRAAWVGLAVFLIVYIASTTGSKRLRLILSLLGALGVLFLLMPYLPGAEVISKRLETFTALNEDRSLSLRSEYSMFIAEALLNDPLGRGMGGVGTGTSLSNEGKLDLKFGAIDNGYLALFMTLGVLGGIVFFVALLRLRRTLRAFESPETLDYVRLANAALLTTFISLIAENCVEGLGAMLLWLLVGIGFGKLSEAQTPARRQGRAKRGKDAERYSLDLVSARRSRNGDPAQETPRPVEATEEAIRER